MSKILTSNELNSMSEMIYSADRGKKYFEIPLDTVKLPIDNDGNCVFDASKPGIYNLSNIDIHEQDADNIRIEFGKNADGSAAKVLVFTRHQWFKKLDYAGYGGASSHEGYVSFPIREVAGEYYNIILDVTEHTAMMTFV